MIKLNLGEQKTQPLPYKTITTLYGFQGKLSHFTGMKFPKGTIMQFWHNNAILAQW